MATSNALRIDELIVNELSGREKLRALIISRCGTIQAWARAHGFYPEQVNMTLRGEREYPEVREAIATDFELDREEVNGLLDVGPDTSTGSAD